MQMTVGTKMPETLSAVLASGALVAAASRTRRMTCDRVVSCPTRSARQVSAPFWLMVAALTGGAGELVHRHTLAGEGRLIDRRKPPR